MKSKLNTDKQIERIYKVILASTELKKPKKGKIICNEEKIEAIDVGVKLLIEEIKSNSGSTQKLLASENKLRSVYQNTSDKITVIDRKGIIQFFNHNTEKLKTSSIIGIEFTSFLPDKKEKELVKKAINHVFKTKSSISYETNIKLLDGEIIYFASTISPLFKENKVTEAIIISKDITVSKIENIAIEENEKKLREITSAIPSIVYQYQIDANNKMKFNFVSEAANEIWGLSPEEVYNDSSLPYSKVHKDDIQRVMDAVLFSNTHNTNFSETFRIHSNDKEIKWLRVDAIPTLNEPGIIVRNGCVIDITKEKKIDEALRKSEFLLNEAQQIAHIGSWELDLANNILSWSDETYEIFEQKKTEFGASYETFLSLIHPEDREELDEVYRNSVATKSPYNITHRLLFPDGRIKHVQERCETYYDVNGKPIRSVGTTQDLTIHIQAENLLKKSQLQYKRVVESIYDGIMSDDIEGNIVFANDQFLNFFGYTAEELETLTIEDLASEEFRSIIRNRHNSRVAGENVPSKFELEGKHKDGTKRWFDVAVSPVIEEGKTIGTQSAIRDITEIKNHVNELKLKEEQLTKLVQELSNKYNELMQFNYIVSHNLRAPVANLLGISNIINLPGLKEHEKDLLLKNIGISTKKMDELLKDLNLILATKTSLNSKKQNVNLSELLKGIFNTLSKEIEESKIEIKTQISTGSEKIYSLKSYIESILYNLISNAIKYKSPLRTPKLAIEIYKQDNKTIITIEDNGIGIDLSKNKDQLFGLYKRFNFEVEGKGLGLHMTKTQIETLGGEIKTESDLKTGTKFTLLLPN